jgi:hypothetical protein
MKWIVGTLYTIVALLVVACDPGMTIRQAQNHNDNRAGLGTLGPRVVVNVKTTRQLFGEAWYDPEVKVTNSLESPIAVTSVELATQRRSYPNTSPKPENYQIAIQPGNTETMKVMFRLDAGVHETFRQPAELRVHYLTDNREEIARITIISGPNEISVCGWEWRPPGMRAGASGYSQSWVSSCGLEIRRRLRPSESGSRKPTAKTLDLC